MSGGARQTSLKTLAMREGITLPNSRKKNMKNIITIIAFMISGCGQYYIPELIDIGQRKDVIKGKAIAERCYSEKVKRSVTIVGVETRYEVRQLCGSSPYGVMAACWISDGIIIIGLAEPSYVCHLVAHEYSHELQFQTGRPQSEPYIDTDEPDPCIANSYIDSECAK